MTDNYLLIRKITDFDSGTYVIKAINDINIPDEKKIDLIVYPLAPTLYPLYLIELETLASLKSTIKPKSQVQIFGLRLSQ